MMKHNQVANKLSTYFIKERGYDGIVFKAEINILTKKKNTAVHEVLL